MVVLCRELGVQTVAEMVETEEQARMLQDFGVALGQGWLFGRPGPLPAEAAAPRKPGPAPTPLRAPASSPLERPSSSGITKRKGFKETWG